MPAQQPTVVFGIDKQTSVALHHISNTGTSIYIQYRDVDILVITSVCEI